MYIYIYIYKYIYIYIYIYICIILSILNIRNVMYFIRPPILIKSKVGSRFTFA